MNKHAIQNFFSSCCGVGFDGGGDGLPGWVLMMGKGGMRRHVPTRVFWWIAWEIVGEEGVVQWVLWWWNAAGDCGVGKLRCFGGWGKRGMCTYFLKAAATPAPQEPFVLQASVEEVSEVVKEAGGEGVRMRMLLGGESKISPTRSVICVIAEKIERDPRCRKDIMDGVLTTENSSSLHNVRLHLVGRLC